MVKLQMITVLFKPYQQLNIFLEQGGKLVLFSHLGKVKEESDKKS